MALKKLKTPFDNPSIKLRTSAQGKQISNLKSDKSKDPTSPKPHTLNPKPSDQEPQSMEELLAVTGYTLRGVKKGDVVEGTVSRVTAKEVAIDIGSKSEGVVIDRELETYKDALMALTIGDRVVAQVIVAENDRGHPVLSLRRSIFEKRWEALAKARDEKTAVEIVLKEPVRGGMIVDYGGLRGYIPQSQLDSGIFKQTDKVSGRRIEAKVIELDRETNRLVFSQKAVTEHEALEKQREIIGALTVDETQQATITGIVPFGAFAKIGVTKDGEKHEVEGLIHISEIAWEKVDDPGQYLKVGDAIKVKVIGLDTETGKLTLSIKQLLPDPWEHVLDMFEKDSEVKGTVSRVTPYGIFVTVSPGIEGLVHISKISPGEEPKVGDEITCVVEEIKADQRKISLSMALKEKPMGYR